MPPVAGAILIEPDLKTGGMKIGGVKLGIVGAGVAGLSCAEMLRSARHAPAVVDTVGDWCLAPRIESARPSGRMLADRIIAAHR